MSGAGVMRAGLLHAARDVRVEEGLDELAEGYAAMDGRSAIKVMIDLD